MQRATAAVAAVAAAAAAATAAAAYFVRCHKNRIYCACAQPMRCSHPQMLQFFLQISSLTSSLSLIGFIMYFILFAAGL